MKPLALTMTSLILSLSMISCSPSQNAIKKHSDYDYDNVSDFHIDFNSVFDIENPMYFIYIYTLNCLHCELIKNDVISYAISNRVPTYFIEYYSDINVSDDVSDTIGCHDVKDLAILGTPTLLMIEEKTLNLNVSGMELIKSVLKEY